MATLAAPGKDEDIPAAVENVLEQALAHQGEHVIKLTDTALASHRRTGQPIALGAAATAIILNA